MHEKRFGRRRFVASSVAASLIGCGGSGAREPSERLPAQAPRFPVLAGTWEWGENAVRTAAQRIGSGGSLLDGIEAGVVAVERDPSVLTVGLAGLPNAEGVVQLDAMIMRGSDLSAGAVGALESIATPIAVARRVMERTRHIYLAGAGAKRFALEQGFTESPPVRGEAHREWQEWRANGMPGGFLRGPDDHDTVGVIGVDGEEAVCGLSTSGLAFKLPGRIGDSPIVGAGGYADARVGAAAATGVGEEVIRVLGSFAVVAAMESGASPAEACERVVAKIRARRGARLGNAQVAFLAVRADGEVGAAALRPGFEYFVHAGGETMRRTI